MQPTAPDQACSSTLPKWLNALLTEDFFVPCDQHNLNSAKKRKEKNSFCLDCMSGVCPNCLYSHSSHQLLQIRRYMYHDVTRLLDIHKLFDCSRVQTYVINSAKVVFLNERRQPRILSKSLSSTCQSCARSLQNTYKFCCVACKVEAVYYKKAAGTVLEAGYIRQVKRLQSSGSESYCSSGTGLSEDFTRAAKSDFSRVLCHEELQHFSTSSDDSSTTENEYCSTWDQVNAMHLTAFLTCNQSRTPAISKQKLNQSPLHHCHLQPFPIAKSAFEISKLFHGNRHQSASPCSVLFPTSTGRRKRKPQRSPLL